MVGLQPPESPDAASDAAQGVGEAAQDAVADGAAVEVVEELEALDVAADEDEALVGRLAQHLGGALAEGEAVVNAGEGVALGAHLQGGGGVGALALGGALGADIADEDAKARGAALARRARGADREA